MDTSDVIIIIIIIIHRYNNIASERERVLNRVEAVYLYSVGADIPGVCVGSDFCLFLSQSISLVMLSMVIMRAINNSIIIVLNIKKKSLIFFSFFPNE